ncbi:unnamed protein product [Ixodes persulcatus]
MRVTSARQTMLRLVVLLLSCASTCHSLECYVCDNQDENNAKCTQTIKTCDPTHTRCLTEVRWGSTPYWAPSGEKQYYISKECASEKRCGEKIASYRYRCDRIWYNDWECAECCTGDRCNYYVTLGGSRVWPIVWLYLVTCALGIHVYFRGL